jgi:hypothetical protein
MLTTLLQAAEEGAESGVHIHPIVVGVLAFTALATLLMVLLVFGKGREHS